ncbi:MAG: DMT family transporter [Nitrososphaerota archaeon]|nr:DMT family transporter [Aigarchaeota archaeon]MDW8076648.1 DMT family transporter [Nitrososphaerota archaeon]
MLGETLTLAAALCWAAGASLYKIGLRNMSPIKLNLVRSCAAAILLLIFVLVLDKSKYFLLLCTPSAAYLLAASLIGWALGDTLYLISLKHIGVSHAVPLTYSYPLFLVPMSIFILREPFTLNIAAGTILIVLAVWLLGGQRKLQFEGSAKLGFIAGILTAICWASGVTLFKLIVESFDPVFAAFFKILVVLPFLAAYLKILGRRDSSPDVSPKKSEVVAAILGGLVSVGLGDMIYLVGLSLTQANTAVPLGSSTPIFSAVLAAIFLKEKLTKRSIISSVLVVFGATLLLGPIR